MSGQNTPRGIRMPLLSIWVRPRATTSDRLERGTWAGALTLFAVCLALTLVSLATFANGRLHWFALAVLGLVGGPVALLLSAMFLKVSGKLMFGKASLRALSTALAWSSVPGAAAALLYIGASVTFPQGFARFVTRLEEYLGSFVGGRAADTSFSVGPGEMPYAVIYAVALLFSLWGVWVTIRAVGAAQRFGLIRSVFNIGLAYGFAMTIAVGVRFFLWQPFSVPSGSMAPTLQAGDYILVNKMSYGYGRYSLPIRLTKEDRLWGARPARGDVVVFHTRLNADFVDRVIGLPGDEIQVKNGVLHINGLPVKTAFLREESQQERTHLSKPARVYKETLPNGVSYEIYDLVPNSDSDNTQVFRVPAGHYFVMGDNRDNSVDSRFSQVGHVPYEDLVAKVGMIYFSVSEPKPDSIARAFSNIAWKRMFWWP